MEPPDSIPNSEVKRLSADDSVGSPHVKVGHRQVFIPTPASNEAGVFYCLTFGELNVLDDAIIIVICTASDIPYQL